MLLKTSLSVHALACIIALRGWLALKQVGSFENGPAKFRTG